MGKFTRAVYQQEVVPNTRSPIWGLKLSRLQAIPYNRACFVCTAVAVDHRYDLIHVPNFRVRCRQSQPSSQDYVYSALPVLVLL